MIIVTFTSSPKANEQSIICNDDGSVELYFNNSKKLETTSTGISITGSIDGSIDNADNINIDGKNDNVNYQVTFSDAGNTGYNVSSLTVVLLLSSLIIHQLILCQVWNIQWFWCIID